MKNRIKNKIAKMILSKKRKKIEPEAADWSTGISDADRDLACRPPVIFHDGTGVRSSRRNGGA